MDVTLKRSDSSGFRDARCRWVALSRRVFESHFNSFFFVFVLCRFKLTQIVVDTSAGPYKNYTVVFLGSDNGHVLKILASTEGSNASFSTQLLEDIDVYNPNKSDHLCLHVDICSSFCSPSSLGLCLPLLLLLCVLP